MNRFITTFARTLALVTLTSLVGCDELDADDIELRTGAGGAAGGLPIAGIPFDDVDVQVTFGVPMQVPAKIKPKDDFDFELPIANNPDYQWTPDPTGAPGIIADAEGDYPYSGLHAEVELSVCQGFLEDHPSQVPVMGTLSACAAAEQGCCDFICYVWGGDPIVENGQNKVGAVTDATFEGKEAVEGAYVPLHMQWDEGEDNGGYGIREKVCQCECTFALEIQGP